MDSKQARTIDIHGCILMIRAALKQGFPKTKFSVRKTRSTWSHNIDVSWTDGPTTKQVDGILKRFVSKGFDGMTDCSYNCGARMLNGEKVQVSGNYVSGHRTLSRELTKMIAQKLADECGLGAVEINANGAINCGQDQVPFAFMAHCLKSDYIPVKDLLAQKFVLAHDSHSTEWFSNLVYRVEHVASFEEQMPISKSLLPEYIDVTATVCTGRAEEFEPRQEMFEGHPALDDAKQAVVFNCKPGKSYTRAQYEALANASPISEKVQ